MTDWTNQLYFGDNLSVLREHIPDESVDLIYLDPPFNSNATYNVLFEEKSGEDSAAQITAFDDTWHWDLGSEAAYRDVVTDGPERLASLLQAMRAFLGQNDMMAYLTMMAQRLAELHRVLKPTGSIYLHCDPTASHYLKLLMDSVFGARNFQNEISWKRTTAHNDAKDMGESATDCCFTQGLPPRRFGTLVEFYRRSNSRDTSMRTIWAVTRLKILRRPVTRLLGPLNGGACIRVVTGNGDFQSTSWSACTLMGKYY